MSTSGLPRAPRITRISIVVAIVAAAGLTALVAPLDGRADATGPACTHGVSASNALGPATGWTEFIEGDANRHNSESEGIVAYGGNLTAGAMNVGIHLLPSSFPATTPSLVVGGNQSGTANLTVGSAYVHGTHGTVNFNGGAGAGFLASNPVDFGTAFTQLRALSTSWGAASATGTVTQGGDSVNRRLVLTGANADLNVFTISAADVAWANAAIQIDVPANATTIINVTGSSVTFGPVTSKIEGKIGSGFQQLDDGNFAGFAGLVWNFPTATTVTLDNGGAFAGAMLAPNAAVNVTGSVAHNVGQVIAKSFDSDRETHLPLFQSESCVPGTPPPPGASDVTVTKSASVASPHGGDTVAYTLTATNIGTSTATGVVIRDELPSGVTFVSATSPCTQAAGVVTCNVGSLAAAASTTVTVTVLANPIAGSGPPPHPSANHWITPYKVETQVDLNAGEQKTVTLDCGPGGILSDGMFRVDHVDQDTGSISGSVQVLSSQSIGVGSWKGVIRNNATGRAQAKAFIVCLPAATDPADSRNGSGNTHQHGLSADATLVTTTASYPVGHTSTTLTCPAATIPVAPGFSQSAMGAVLSGSEYDAAHPRDWTFTVEATAPTTVTLSVRCLRTTVDPVAGHTHELRFVHIVQTVTVPGHTAKEGDEFQVTCPDDAKGIVGTWDLPPGVQHFGNDPRIKTRAFRLFNDTGVAKQATLDLLCLRDRTTSEEMGTPTPVVVPNTATVTSISVDANPLNNSASASITVQPGSSTTSLLRSGRATASAFSMGVVSSMPGRGAMTVRSHGMLLAQGSVTFKPGKASTASLELTAAGKRQLARLDHVTVKVDPTRGHATTGSVTVQH
jgi:choice-of-anchor A domain-containing protein/uncharacterized repeat protein (TIGR01451 family)